MGRDKKPPINGPINAPVPNVKTITEYALAWFVLSVISPIYVLHNPKLPLSNPNAIRITTAYHSEREKPNMVIVKKLPKRPSNMMGLRPTRSEINPQIKLLKN